MCFWRVRLRALRVRPIPSATSAETAAGRSARPGAANRATGPRGRTSRRKAPEVTVTGILINILNPKLSIFFLAFLPQFVSAGEAQPLSRMLELSAVFMLMTFVVFVGYGLFAASIRDHVISRPRVLTWMRRAFAGAFVALGAKLAFADR